MNYQLRNTACTFSKYCNHVEEGVTTPNVGFGLGFGETISKGIIEFEVG